MMASPEARGGIMATRAFEPNKAAAMPPPILVERRAASRHAPSQSEAALTFRGQILRVKVVDISSRGARIESPITPRLGESVTIRFDGCSPLYAFVRWNRDGRIGLDFGCVLTVG
jgi:hypothetical protein